MREYPVKALHRTPGRAAGSNPDVRFDTQHREVVDDGWDRDEELPVLRTEVSDEVARKIVTRNTSPDLSFDRSINPYRGCEHGCIYCFARPSHAFLGLSPGLDFETKLIARPNAAEKLREELSNPRYQPATLAIGTNTDPYQPIERDRRIMRDVLEVLHDFNHPVAIVTKGTLIERDAGILAEMAGKGLARVGISVTTLDNAVSRVMEPRVPFARRPFADDPQTDRCGRTDPGHGVTDRPRTDRSRDGGDLDRMPRCRCRCCVVNHSASAVGSGAIVQGLARRTLPRPCGARHGSGAGTAWRQGLRSGIWAPHGRAGGMGGDDAATFQADHAQAGA